MLDPWRAGWSSVGKPGYFWFPEGIDTAATSRVNVIESLKAVQWSGKADPNCNELNGCPASAAVDPYYRVFNYQPWDNLIEDVRHTRTFAALAGPLGQRARYRMDALWSAASMPRWRTQPSHPPFPLLHLGFMEIAPSHPNRQAFCADVDLSRDFAAECAKEENWYWRGRPFGNGDADRRAGRDRQTWRVAGAVEGSLDGPVFYDLALSYSGAKGNIAVPAILAERLFLAFRGYGRAGCGVGVVVDDSLGPGMRIADTAKRPGTGGCEYYNPFGTAIRKTTFRTPSVDDLLDDVPLTATQNISQVGAWIPVDTYGDADIEPERAFTYGIGVVVFPLAGAELALDYWSYDFENVIAGVPHDRVDDLYANARTRHGVARYVHCASGRSDLVAVPCGARSITRIEVPLGNWPGVETAGFDVEARAVLEAGPGELRVGAGGTYTLRYDVRALVLDGIPIQDPVAVAGRLNFGSPLVAPIPDWKAQAFLSYEWRECRASLYVNHVSSYLDAGSHDGYGGVPVESFNIDGFTTLDVGFGRRFPALGMDVAFHLLNLTDREPPFANVEHAYARLRRNDAQPQGASSEAGGALSGRPRLNAPPRPLGAASTCPQSSIGFAGLTESPLVPASTMNGWAGRSPRPLQTATLATNGSWRESRDDAW